MKIFSVILLVGIGFVWLSSGEAEVSPPSASPSPSFKSIAPQGFPLIKNKLRGKKKSEKETEGTEALHRFEMDTIIKSRYELNGDPLEVDPD
jgi:hypothetical protein